MRCIIFVMKCMTRQRIVGYLSKITSATATEIGVALGMTRANVQHHLKFLQEEKIVEALPRYHVSGTSAKGRPELFYRLSHSDKPGNLEQLTAILLDHTFKGCSKGSEITAIARSLANNMFEAPAQDLKFTGILNRAVQELNKHNYEARWEAHVEGPRIQFTNCPYASLLSNHPELCKIDAQVLERLVGKTATQLSCLKTTASSCIFTIAANTGAKDRALH
jgi:predicted ArsR family transcriptional regulator